MNYYIAYKYTKIKDKKKLREDLKTLSHKLEGAGNKTFVLGRDIVKWDNRLHALSFKFPRMINEIKRADALLALITSNSISLGLTTEFLLAKFLKKNIYILKKEGTNCDTFSKLADKTITYSDIKTTDLNF